MTEQPRRGNSERRELLRAPSDGWVVALPEVGHCTVGVACATLAVPEEEP